MVHPDTELRFINSTIGHGVVATKFIPKGTIIWVLDELDRIFTPGQYAAFKPPYSDVLRKYCYVDFNGNHVLCWDHARFFNHSCNPNCMNTGMAFEIALRDLQPGDELTDDYGSLNMTLPFECLCGTPQCRRAVRADDVVKLAPLWDDWAHVTLPLIPTQKQPLWDVVRDADKVRIAQGVADPSTIPSCLSNFYRGERK